MFNLFKSAPKAYEDLDGKTFREKYESTPKAKLLDVRTPGEFASGTIKGAKNLDITSPQFQTAIKTMDKTEPYFLFCRSGARSGNASKLMADQGFKVYNLSGGIGAWPK
ncbi:rhodanese-like domain-containing protein [Botryobacter ruber]|uniref:rhodanese-like domain-containing protein n=1 Tax=Botryobacter ruber TaxID=2171629 RepID=UPI000E0B8DA9|nr:rhodanese-like domain-containing protein [Botryobacter ruber]